MIAGFSNVVDLLDHLINGGALPEHRFGVKGRFLSDTVIRDIIRELRHERPNQERPQTDSHQHGTPR
jgi:hypothetical protein